MLRFKNFFLHIFRPPQSHRPGADVLPDAPRITISGPPHPSNGPANTESYPPARPYDNSSMLHSKRKEHAGKNDDNIRGPGINDEDERRSDGGGHRHDDGEDQSDPSKLQINVEMSVETAAQESSSSLGIAVQPTNTSGADVAPSIIGLEQILESHGVAPTADLVLSSDFEVPLIAGYMEPAVLNSILDSIGALHPFVKPVAEAVKMVRLFYQSHKKNQRYVRLLSDRMYATAHVLIDLKTAIVPEDSSELQRLISLTAQDIEACLNSCDTYATQSKAVRVLRGPSWEKHFGKIIKTFNERRKGLQDVLIRYHIQLTMDVMSEVKDIKQITQEVKQAIEQSASELEVQMRSFVQSKGGIRAVRDNESALRWLISREGGDATEKKAGLQNSLLEQLKDDLSRDIATATQQNLRQFQVKMEFSLKQMDNKLDKISTAQTQVLKAVGPGMYAIIRNEELKDLWGEITKSTLSIETSRFVRTLHEHYTHLDALVKLQLVEARFAELQGAPTVDAKAFHASHSNNAWALHLIKGTELRYIFDAFDEDGSGYVSLVEFNRFAESLPSKDWSGYPTGVSNRYIVDKYLSEVSTQLLRTTVGLEVQDRSYSTPAKAKFRAYAAQEETRIAEILKIFRYIESPDIVHVVMGEGKMELHLFTLIYVLMRQHLSTMLFAKRHVLHDDELEKPIRSLEYVFQEVNARVEELSSHFRKYNLDLKEKWTTFARGLYTYHHDAESLWSTKHVLKREQPMRSLYMEDESDSDDDGELEAPSNSDDDDDSEKSFKSRLEYGVQNFHLRVLLNTSADLMRFQTSESAELPNGENDERHHIQGRWTGYIYFADHQSNTAHSLIRTTSWEISLSDEELKIHTSNDWDDLSACSTVSGKYELKPNGAIRLTFEGVRMVSVFFWRKSEPQTFFTFAGEISQDGILTGSLLGGSPGDQSTRHVFFKKVPGEVMALTPLPTEVSNSSSSTRARSLWAFARACILYHVRRQCMSFLLDRRQARRTLLSLRSSNVFEGSNTPPDALVCRLVRSVTPTQATFYAKSAEYIRRIEPQFLGYYCDRCNADIKTIRLMCLQCPSADSTAPISDTVDFCGSGDKNCAEIWSNESALSRKSISRGDTSHMPDHVLVKHRDFFITGDIPTIREDAESTLEIARNHFEQMTSSRMKAVDDSVEVDDDDDTSVKCSICREALSMPCWACVTCRAYKFMCKETNTAKEVDPEMNDAEQGTATMGEDGRLARLEHRLAEVEKVLNNVEQFLQRVPAH
ncbi:hypothetical protein EIP91_010247 [Steccherinum ochraceum]|uniref:EF-hand domain-containing protein n=1 Tax=Steccherinum ochraceum TaxID=92696 RepID=A0A4R0R0U1_9APHY|nr:hypothetical protein EIP91_010247 [Steccherinum ochraceum]